jgi:hypothetical protein
VSIISREGHLIGADAGHALLKKPYVGIMAALMARTSGSEYSTL